MEREFRGWDRYDADSVGPSQDLFRGLSKEQFMEMKHIFLGFNSLNLAPNQIVEVISGNISKNKIPLDINYMPIMIGDENKSPKTNRGSKIIEAEKIDKRGIGYHFQVNTRNRMDQECTYNKNFVLR